ncbi:hypothetical protein [Geomesophilobacter sediminis]|uniref:Uncharacterized protein n=1 Tax=Geomesophilobacter sediminis TaxID=2798584 RepID=A0A8J7M0L3_9BACT|nr:hypothetical protein [Geomesophilobacter sediminis]MBJ6725787.1 hypothetical protein [Geomesophilobacter sediminis]
MKKTILTLVVSAALVASAVTAFAADQGKDACLLNSENCSSRSLSITEIIARLKTEIGKGSSVYTADELRVLNGKLSEYQNFLEKMQES